MQLLLCVAWLGRSDALEASGLFRRRAVLAKTGTAAVAVAAPLVATAATDAELESNPALVWRPGETNSKRKTTCGTATRKVFPGAFVNYLSRFLLTYDRGSRVLWRADAEEIPLAWDAPKVKGKRAQQFAAFAASVEAGLCDYAEKSATEAGEPSETPQLGVRQLLSLLRSRYGDMPDAPRQLALTFSLQESRVRTPVRRPFNARSLGSTSCTNLETPSPCSPRAPKTPPPSRYTSTTAVPLALWLETSTLRRHP